MFSGEGDSLAAGQRSAKAIRLESTGLAPNG